MLKIGAVMFCTTDSMHPAELGTLLEERGFESLGRAADPALLRHHGPLPGAQRAIRYGNGWIPLAGRLDQGGIGTLVGKFRLMATEAGRDPASLPITVFRAPAELDRLKYCEEIGIDRVTFSLPAEGREALLPIIDQWAELKHRLDAG